MPQHKDDNRLPIGLGSDVLLQLKGLRERLKGFLVGMEPAKYILLKIPSASVLNEEIDTGAEMVVRYVFMGNVFAFRATVLGGISEPFPITFISYPQSIESLNLRSAKRIECNIPCDLFIRNKQTPGVIMDISYNGAGLTCELSDTMKIDTDDEISLSFPLPGMKGEQYYTGLVRNIVKDKTKASLGVQFINLDPILKDRLRSYIDSVLERL